MKFDLIIVGGGLAGAALAVALRRSALRIAVVEHAAPRRPTGWDARIYAYSPASARFLDCSVPPPNSPSAPTVSGNSCVAMTDLPVRTVRRVDSRAFALA